ncbi:MAG: hypothetical protein R2932_17140 [Caldilineaceae bacterium]
MWLLSWRSVDRQPRHRFAPGPNLTPGGALASWTEADFITALRTGRTPDGRELSAAMPWRGYAQMTEIELRALWAYLQTLEAQASTLVE